MNLLLGFIASVGLTSPSVATIANNNNLNNTIVLNENDQEKIVLSKIKTNDTVSNLDWTTPSTTDEEIYDYIMTEIMTSNMENDIITDALMDVLFYPENWKKIGFPIKVPKPNEQISQKLKFMADKNNPTYFGFLEFNVDVTKSEEIIEEPKQLSEVIEYKDLGAIENPTQDKVFNKFFELNSNIKRTDVEFETVNYKNLILEADPSGPYVGRVVLTYQAKVKLLETWKSEKIEAEAYNSYQEENRSYKIEYKPEFGLENFRNKFSKVDFTYSGEYKVKTYNEDDWTNVEPTKTSISLADASRKDIWNKEYFGSVNWNTSKAWTYIEFTKNDTEIELTFNIQAEAYANWMNAYWARAGAQLNIKNIQFS
ncbi:hypothetical protein [Spiroplasma endosymbiont of Cantharis rufa]|uniref:hypothetical protein n=1 Tax=Spiroplasma endosymbiont of Cantharis rufa TaxID=3066279 RepID=UPI0030D0BBB7